MNKREKELLQTCSWMKFVLLKTGFNLRNKFQYNFYQKASDGIGQIFR